MCGVAGILGFKGDTEELRSRLRQMQARLRHRGPDDEGIFIDVNAGTGLAHTRLAILDLSSSGHQPMLSEDGRYSIVFNGEIYNFLSLRSELEQSGEEFRSRSDTEVILRLYQKSGPQFVKRLSGMFAVAIWDNQDRTCFLARDGFGIKPLYIWQHHGTLAFASEVRALLKADLTTRQLCGPALRDYFQYGSVQEPLTLVEGVTVLEPGRWMIWKDRSKSSESFWQPTFSSSDNILHSPTTATRLALDDSINRHFVSDVPVSIFLSGGIDSTAIVALAHKQGYRNLRTFCLSFEESDFDEGSLAARTARHFGTEHHDWRITASEGSQLLPQFLDSVDQPGNDGFNTFCVSRFAHRMGAKVVLSGLGGDELFGGYPSFRVIPRLMNWYRVMSMVPAARTLAGSVAGRFLSGNRGARVREFLSGTGEIENAYRCMRGIFDHTETDKLLSRYLSQMPDGASCETPPRDEVLPAGSDADKISYLEMTRYMRNQLLRDSDTMSMAWGLELRVPFVDRSLFETVSRIPAAIRLAAGKRLLLDAVPEVPEWISGQPKRGFRFPFQEWTTGRWKGLFSGLEAASPVPLRAWYQKWTVFALEYFLERNEIVCSERLLDSPGMASFTNAPLKSENNAPL